MNATPSIYRGFCFPGEIISHAVFLYHRFSLSFRDVEDLLAHRGITVSYETIRRWCRRFGPIYAQNLRRKQPTQADHWFLDEVFVNIQGQRQYLWRAIDQDGDIIDVVLQRRRNGRPRSDSFASCSRDNDVLRTDWSPINWAATAWHTAKKCRASRTIQHSTQTTELKRRTGALE